MLKQGVLDKERFKNNFTFLLDPFGFAQDRPFARIVPVNRDIFDRRQKSLIWSTVSYRHIGLFDTPNPAFLPCLRPTFRRKF